MNHFIKMKRSFFIFFIISICINFFKCSEEEFIIELQYDEGGCYNPWGTTNDIKKIKAFLIEKDIHPIKIYRKSIYPPGTFLCMSCFCPSGRAVFITIFPMDEQKALDLGFVKAYK